MVILVLAILSLLLPISLTDATTTSIISTPEYAAKTESISSPTESSTYSSDSTSTTEVTSSTSTTLEPVSLDVSAEAISESEVLVRWNVTRCDIPHLYVSLVPLKAEGFNCSNDAKTQTKEISCNLKSVTIDQLLPYYSYRVYVLLNDGTTNSVDITTLDGALPVPAISLNATESRSVYVEWNFSDCVPAKITNYSVSVISVGPKGLNCATDENPHLITVGPSQMNVTLSNLEPYYEYQVLVTVNTENGQVTQGDSTIITLQEDLPVPVVLASAIQNRSVYVQWILSDCVPAKIANYSVSLSSVGPKGLNCRTDANSHWTIVGPSQMDVTFSRLEPFYEYEVVVAVNAENGEVKQGKNKTTTLQEVPPAPDVDLTELENGDLLTNWTMSSRCIPGNLKGYRLNLTFNGSNDLDCLFQVPDDISYVGSDVQENEFENIIPYSRYQLTVTAETEAGFGNSSETREIETSQQVPSPPDVDVSNIKTTSFEISWTLPACMNSSIEGFLIYANRTENIPVKCHLPGKDTFESNVTAGEESIKFERAVPYSFYKIEVRAYTADNVGEAFDTVIKTLEADPSVPYIYPRVISSRDVNITWNVDCVFANITSYNINVTSVAPKGYLCDVDNNTYTENITAPATYVVFNDLQPFYEYKVSVLANTETGKQAAANITFTTLQEVPPAPVIEAEAINSTAINITWRFDQCVPGEVSNCLVWLTFLHSNNPECLFTQDGYSDYALPVQQYYVYDRALPYSLYQVEVNATTGGGTGPTSDKQIVMTNEDFPPPPEIEDLQALSKSISVAWKMMKCINGSLSDFTVSLIPEDYIGEEVCNYINETKSSITVPSTTMVQIFDPVWAYYTYTVEITAWTGAGQGAATNKMVQTLKYFPDSVRDVKVTDLVFNQSDATVWWKEPCHYFGNFKNYKVYLKGSRPYFDDQNNVSTVETREFVITDLQPEYNYTILVTAVNDRGLESKEAAMTTLYRPAGIPDRNGSLAVPDPYDTDDATIKARMIINKDLFNPYKGCIVYYAILLSEEPIEPQSGVLPAGQQCDEWIKPTGMIQATPPCWNPFVNATCIEPMSISFTLGDDESCKGDFCNKPLEPGSKYYVTVRGYTMSTYVDSTIAAFTTDSAPNVGLIVGSVLSIILVSGGLIYYVLYRKGMLPWPPKAMLMQRQLDAQPKPVSLTRFPAYSDYMLEVPSRISNEYQLLQTFGKDIADAESCSAALQPENRRKNRYSNVLPFDSTRVPLEPLPDDPMSDYINASFIKGYSGGIEYIATQGPKEETCHDFWRMVQQQGVKLIIMLTNFEENEKVKCHRYFPPLREHMVFGDITVRCTTELTFPIYTSRTFQLLKGDRQRSIVHLHFREWPDFGCPLTADLMLHFVQVVRHQITLHSPCLCVVHCSAGVGRTGTLIAVDILLQHIKEHKKVDIFGTVFNLRRQRMSMVQSEPQYVYVYNCVKEALTDPKYLQSEKSSTSSTEPIYENIKNENNLLSYEMVPDRGLIRPLSLEGINITSFNDPVYENLADCADSSETTG